MSNGHQTSPHPGFGLRPKLSLGFVGLLAVLLAVGVESITLLGRLGGSIDVILRENYKSVVACERMKESLERMDSGALFGLAGEEARGRSLAVQHRPRFEAALETERGNITLPGEGERAERLRQLYTAYVPVLDRVLAAQVSVEERRALYFGRLLPTFQQIKRTADEILQMNQQNMVAANDRARRLAAAAGRRMAMLLLLGTAFAGIFIAFLSRSILGPLERLTRAARDIEGGDLDVSVPVSSRDEIGQLAAAFNSMAAGLRELHRSDQGRLLAAHRVAQHAIDSLTEAVVVVSPERRVELANRAAETLLGLRPGEAIPESHARWILPLLEGAERERQPAHSGGSEAIRLPVEEGGRFLLPRIAALREGEEDRVTGLILILADVTEQRRSGEVTRELLANASHDLDAALAPLRSALAGLLQEAPGSLTPQQRSLLTAIDDSAGRLGQIGGNLLGVARLEARRRELHIEPVLPQELIAAAVRPLEEPLRREHVALAVEVDPAAPRVLVDRERAGLLLTSLLRNALAHTPAGGAITVRARPFDGRVRFSVIDTGHGIPREHLGRLFEPFFQVPGTENLGDAGFGLAIARDIVQAHGGEIHCESEGEGRGATFWFTLPAATN